MELHDGRRRPKGNRDDVLKAYVMSAIADDYEDFQEISTVTTRWASEDGLQFDRKEILIALGKLIQSGDAQCYLLSPHPPHTSLAEYSESRVEEVWFMLTTKGIWELSRLDAQ